MIIFFWSSSSRRSRKPLKKPYSLGIVDCQSIYSTFFMAPFSVFIDSLFQARAIVQEMLSWHPWFKRQDAHFLTEMSEAHKLYA